MSLISGEGNFQELLGQNASQITADIDDLDVLNSLKLEYATPDKNLVVDSNKNVITEDKDSFVDVPNKITWSQVGRQFTANLPQRIDTNCQFVCEDLTSTDDIRLDGELYFRKSGGGNNNNIYFQNSFNHAISYIVPTSGYDDAFFRFKINNSNSIKIGKTIIEPLQTNITLGKTSAPFAELYLKNKIDFNAGTNKLWEIDCSSGFDFNIRYNGIDASARVKISNPTEPSYTDVLSLGSSTYKWKDIYLKDGIILNGTTLDSTQFNRLVGINQDLSTSSNVSFNTITTTGRTLNLNSNGKVRITSTGDNVIRFHTNDTVRWITSDTRLRPNTNNTYDLGGGSYTWGNGYIRTLILRNGNVKIASGDNNSIDFYVAGETHTVRLQNNTFRPNLTTYDLGNDTWRWNSLYLKTSLDLNTTDAQISLPFKTTSPPTIKFGNTNSGISFKDIFNMTIYINGAVFYYLHPYRFHPNFNNSMDIGTSSQRFKDCYVAGNAFFNTSSAGYVSMNELRSVDYQSGSPTNDSFVEMRGQKQFLRFRRGGDPVFTTGIMFSHFDTSNFYINSSGSGNLRISHGTLINEGDGGGSVNATRIVDIKSNGEIRANHFSNEKGYRCHLWLNQLGVYTEVISTTFTYEKFNTLMSQTLGTELTNFTFSTSTTELTYTGEIDRYFMVKYKITGRTTNTSTTQKYETIIARKQGATENRYNESRCINVCNNDISCNFSGEAIVKLEPNDNIYMLIRNNTSTDDLLINSFSLMAYDLNYLAT